MSTRQLPNTSITIRNLPASLKERLRVQAAQSGHSMEAEARRILQAALVGPQDPGQDFYQRVHARFAGLAGADFEVPPREMLRDPPAFE